MKPALYVVTVEVSPSAEEAWNRWHEDVHVPEVLQQPGFLRCRKWKDTTNAQDGWARYVCHYELTDKEAVDRYVASDAAKHLRAESDKHFGYVTRPSRAVLTEVATFG